MSGKLEFEQLYNTNVSKYKSSVKQKHSQHQLTMKKTADDQNHSKESVTEKEENLGFLQ